MLDEQNIRQIIEFAQARGLVLLADEVYQENTYMPDRPFVSFKKVLTAMGPAYRDVQLFSFHSVSKGFVGECGKRGGYFEVCNVDEDVLAQVYKLARRIVRSLDQSRVWTGLQAKRIRPAEGRQVRAVGGAETGTEHSFKAVRVPCEGNCLTSYEIFQSFTQGFR